MSSGNLAECCGEGGGIGEVVEGGVIVVDEDVKAEGILQVHGL